MMDLATVMKATFQGDYSKLLLLGNGWGLNSVLALPYCYDLIEEEKKYEIVLNIYAMLKGHVSCMVPYIKDIKRYRPDDYLKEFPDELVKNGFVTIYRGGSESKNQTAYRTSWTIDKKVAVWFAKRLKLFGYEGHVYSRMIAVDDIIAYYNGRSEMEILQYHKVRGVKELLDWKEEPNGEV